MSSTKKLWKIHVAPFLENIIFFLLRSGMHDESWESRTIQGLQCISSPNKHRQQSSVTVLQAHHCSTPVPRSVISTGMERRVWNFRHQCAKPALLIYLHKLSQHSTVRKCWHWTAAAVRSTGLPAIKSCFFFFLMLGRETCGWRV